MNVKGVRARLLRAGYAWELSEDPLLIAMRAGLDTRLRRPASAVSIAGPQAPAIGYSGARHGLVKVLQFLEERQEAMGAGRATVEPGLDGADLVAVACSADKARRLPRTAALVLPYRLHLVVDMPETPGEWRRAVSRRERQWFNARNKAADLALEIATDDDSFHFFYDRMHAPTMRERHGDRARSEAKDVAYECLFHDGLLAFATVDGRRVAGVLCHRGPSTITVRLLGVLDGAESAYRDGAMKVLYHLLLDWADRNGLAHVDFGGTEAWISKGIFQWKRRFGPRLAHAPNHFGTYRVWWNARRDTPAVRDFLVANPVLELTEDQPPHARTLQAVYFHDDDRPARLDLAYACANVDRHRTAHLDEFLAGLPKGASRHGQHDGQHHLVR
jgi:hypothetical protein